MILWCRCHYLLLKPGKIWDLEITVDAVVPSFILASRLKHCPPSCWEGFWAESFSRVCHWPKELLLSRPCSSQGQLASRDWNGLGRLMPSPPDRTIPIWHFSPRSPQGSAQVFVVKASHSMTSPSSQSCCPHTPPLLNVVLKSTPSKSTESDSEGTRSIQGNERNTSSQCHSLRKS